MSYGIVGIFLGFSLILTSSITIPLSLLVVKETNRKDYSALMSFLSFGSFSLFFFSIFFVLSQFFSMESIGGIDTNTAVPLFGFFIVFSILGTDWQIYEYSREGL